VALSGDTRVSENLIKAAAGVDVLIHEVIDPEALRNRPDHPNPAAIDAIVAHHTTPEQAGEVFTRVAPHYFLAGPAAMTSIDALRVRSSQRTMDPLSSAPRAPRNPRTKTIGAVTFVDPYADLQADSPEALAWQWEQDRHAERVARGSPGFSALRAKIATLGASWDMITDSARRLRGGRWFWGAPSARSPLRTLWSSPTLEGPGAPVFEVPDVVRSEEAATHGLFWFEPSPNGEVVAAQVAGPGAASGTWFVFEVGTGRRLSATAPAVPASSALPGWLPDGSGFYHGDRTDDGRHRVAFVPVKEGVGPRPSRSFDVDTIPANVGGLTIDVSPNGHRAIGISGPHERIAYVIGDLSTGEWRPFLPEGYEGECEGAWLDDATYVARAHSEDAPRGRIVAIPVATSRNLATWRELEPEREGVLRAVTIVERRIAIAEVLHCSVRFRTLDLNGRDERIVPLEGPGNSFIAFMLRRFDRSDALVLDYQTFDHSSALYRCDGEGRLTTVRPPKQNVSGISVTQRFARSRDGARVPYFLVHRSDLSLTEPRPALVSAYGGFNVAWMPTFLNHLAPFVEAGGVLVHANLRGGGEYGKQWHESGRLACKWNVFLDLFAVAEQVIADRVTVADRLAMTGLSNGGLLAGAAIVHRPDLWRVVVPVVPLLDMMEAIPEGPEFAVARSVFAEDYGDPADPVFGRLIHSYSPYHNIRNGVRYPAVFQVFGEKDQGCLPFNGRKFTARLQEATSSGRPVLLRVWKDTGHMAFDPEVATLQAAEWVGFVMQELGLTVR
jgi:prolyl oligopeptidase